MTRTETTELSISFTPKDQAQAFDYEFTDQGALVVSDLLGNRTSISFCPEHISAIEDLLNILYLYRGDYADVLHPYPVHDLEAAA